MSEKKTKKELYDLIIQESGKKEIDIEYMSQLIDQIRELDKNKTK